MDSFVAAPALVDDPLIQVRDLPQLPPNLRIPPLRDPIPSRSHRVPSPLEPNAGGIRESNVPKTSLGGNPPAELPTLADFLNAARTHTLTQLTSDAPSNSEPPPKTILPAFINLRAVEKLPYASFDEDARRKRRRLDVQGDAFGEHLQLPIPKNQKEVSKPPPFGPLTILNGLNEPPPNAALFPPIESDTVPTILSRPTRDTHGPEKDVSSESHDARRGRRIDEIIEPSLEEDDEIMVEDDEDSKKSSLEAETNTEQRAEDCDNEPASPKLRVRPRKKLRKWTEQETNDLLRGVVKCGIGNWTTILAQPELKFNKRSAANLKDRFRVCCPWAYGDQNTETEDAQKILNNSSNPADPNLAGKILLPDPRSVKSGIDSIATSANFSVVTSTNTAIDSLPPGSAATPAPTKSISNSTSTSSKPKWRNKYPPAFKASPTLSNKSKSTLVSLGIPEPYFSIKSNRRSRRPFTPAEDEALLKGYAVHGFQWTLIRQDKHLNLMHRKATDLRDRFRTKFPHAYREGGSATAKNIEAGGKEPVSITIPLRPCGVGSQRGFISASGSQVSQLPLRGASRQPTCEAANRREERNLDSVSSETPGSAAIPIDPAMLPPAPPSGLPDLSSVANASVFPFSMDDNGTSVGENIDFRSTDNTLAPLVWDDLG